MQRRDLANSIDNPMNAIISAGVAARIDYLKNTFIPKEHFKFHTNCSIHIHDIEFYDSSYNCIGVNVQKLIGDNHSFRTACRALIREIISLTNSQSGGIGIINFDHDMSVYAKDAADSEIHDEIFELLQDLNAVLRKGCEKAYVTFNFGLDTSDIGRRISRILLDVFEKGIAGSPFIFPNLVFKVKNGINLKRGDLNYDLFRFANSVTAKCMIPTYFNTDSDYNSDYISENIGIMGCRTRVAANRFSLNQDSLFRGNVAAVTINLVQLAIENGNIQKLKKQLLDVMNNASEILIHRFGALSKNGYFDYLREKDLWLENEKHNEVMLKNGTLSIGFIGLWEAIALIEGYNDKDLPLDVFSEAGVQIVEFMRKTTDSFTEKYDYNFSLLATSAEGVCGKFPKHDLAVYGVIRGVTDKEFYTNSFHVPVYIDVGALEKLKTEAPFHRLCNGGCISYVEFNESPANNPQAIEDLVRFAYEHNMNYIGANFPIDLCECGMRGTFTGSCPMCGGNNIKRLRRVSGYLSETSMFTVGKRAELKSRNPHYGMVPGITGQLH